MKSASVKSALRLVRAVDSLLKCPEMQANNVSEKTHKVVDEIQETAAQVQRECTFPDRSDIIQFLAKRFSQEDHDLLVKRLVELVSTLSNEAIYRSYEELCTEKAASEPSENQKRAKKQR